AHIHEGEAGTAGPAVIPLEPPKEGPVDTCAEADPAVVQRVIANPSGFYVNVHNQEFPGGAVRGQLQSA
ncbi:MAG: CHRD domain-containing protein, partial [Actinomycetota bacterium]|nr:CHRD domain-containing protein [Actinomycetota bacterium]